MTEIRDRRVPEGAASADECAFALNSVQSFLHGELPETSADEIREHLMMCEHCMDYFDIEQMISAMVKRCCCTPAASEELRMRINSIRVTTTDTPPDA